MDGSERGSGHPGLLSRQHKAFIWIALGLVLLTLIPLQKHARSSTTAATNSDGALDTSPQPGNYIPKAHEVRPPQPALRPPPTTASTEQILAELRAKVTELEEGIKQSTKVSADLVKQVTETEHRLERVEDAAFSDGSNAFIAVMENAFFSPTGKRWVKLCDWTDCQFQTLEASAASLLKRTAAVTQPAKASSSAQGFRAVHLVNKCPNQDNIFVGALQEAFGKDKFVLVSSEPLVNCSFVVKTQAEVLELTLDKTLDVVVIEGNEQEDKVPVIENYLRSWVRKVKVGGAVVGQDYVVSKPFNERWKKHSLATPHEKATKAAVDRFRTGDDNELGQEDTVRVAGGSLWYFTKVKPSIFGL